MTKHFAFVNMPAHGHVNPTLPLVEELVNRGHRVTYAVGAKLAGKVKATGATVLELDGELPGGPPTGAAGGFSPEQMAQAMQVFLDSAWVDFPVLIEHFQRDLPDAVCYDPMALTGRVLGEKLGVPSVSLVPNFAGNEHFSLRDEFMPDGFDPDHPALVEVGERIRAFGAEFGVSAPTKPMEFTPDELNLVFIPREFQLAAETFDDRFRFLGPALGSRADEPFTPAQADRPLLFISLGTAFNQQPGFFRSCLEAFGDSRWQVAMAIGDRLDPAELGDIPDNVEVREMFPQPAVLARARLFLSHAGMNSTMESLQAGVPLVAVPQMGEQRANATRVEQLGCGRQLDAQTVTAEQLRAAVDEIDADEAVRENVEQMSAALRSCGGPVAGADALEQHLA